ncbi:MAG: hypothetical protein HY271_05255 [Deltaproteobacteria bacterium]|nr:hypothetical protein [Deltaproteobacteria bacterium]
MKGTLSMMAAAMSLLTTAAFAGEVRTYQVTGAVVSVSDGAITVKKGNDNWEIAKGADTKSTGDVKVGDKVTILYRMSATSIEAKPAAAKKK